MIETQPSGVPAFQFLDDDKYIYKYIYMYIYIYISNIYIYIILPICRIARFGLGTDGVASLSAGYLWNWGRLGERPAAAFCLGRVISMGMFMGIFMAT